MTWYLSAATVTGKLTAIGLWGATTMERPLQEFNFWTNLFRGLLAAAPLISLIDRIFSPDLIPILQDFIAFYRSLIKPIVDVLFFWTSWRPWQWLVDVYTLHFVIFIAGIRSIIRVSGFEDFKKDGLTPVVVTALIPFIFFIGYAGMTIAEGKIEDKYVLRNWFISLGMAILAAAAFFAANAGLS